MNELPQNIQVKTESVQNIADSIRSKNHSNQKYKIGEMSSAIDDMKVAIPNTMLTINANGVYDVSTDEKVSVEVPVPSGAIEITQNGRTDVKDYIYADVNVPQPSGSTTITSNGTYDVTQYASAIVNTSSYTPSTTKTITSNGTGINVSTYEFADVDVKAILKNGQQFTNLTYDTSNEDDFYNFVNQFDWTNITTVSFSNSTGIKKFKMPSTFKPSSFSCSPSSFNMTLSTVELIDTSNMTSMYQTFYKNQGIVNFPEFDTSNVTTITNILSVTSGYIRLTNTSWNNILNMCRKSGVTTNKTLTSVVYGITNLTTSEQDTLRTTLQGLTNYQDFIDSGWTLGF
ncbi:MAG: hypothetical protein J6S85_04745 [Methanobrevibacter sp.]|nr:hypothetical protein [Methanobrevibacter sp.]